MKNRKKHPVLGFVSVLAILAAVIYIYAGFFYPDPFFVMSQPRTAFVIVWGARILIPLFALALFIIYRRLRTGKLKIKYLVLSLVLLMIPVMIMYPLMNMWYNSRVILDKYHPYLQLTPRSISVTAAPFTVVCMGGSTTEFKDSKGKGWPARVEIMLEKMVPGRDIKVYNQGRQWYTTLHSLINYETNIRQYKPDMIVIMHTINDLLHNADFSYFSHGRFREDYGHFYGPVKRLVTRAGMEKSLIRLIKRYWYFKGRETVDMDTFPGEAPFERNLKTIIDLAEKDGVQVVLMTQPSLYHEKMAEEIKPALYMLNYEAVGPRHKWSYETALNGFKRYNAIVEKIAGEQGVIFIDLDKKIPKTLEYFKDDVHYRDKAFDMVASVIAEELKIFLEGRIEKKMKETE
ncbi:MAG: GDSL-type esterase/lipase family protein [Elusimicrobiota bacterium]